MVYCVKDLVGDCVSGNRKEQENCLFAPWGCEQPDRSVVEIILNFIKLANVLNESPDVVSIDSKYEHNVFQHTTCGQFVLNLYVFYVWLPAG